MEVVSLNLDAPIQVMFDFFSIGLYLVFGAGLLLAMVGWIKGMLG